MGRAFVDHTYTDHLYDTPSIKMNFKVSDLAVKSRLKGPRGGSTVPFPVKLHQMLTWTEQQGLESVVGWQQHGRSFLVRIKQRFVRDIMPLFFQQSKMSSFQRQLNLYGFNRMTAGNDQGCYYHPLFLRSRDFLCERMVRTRVKGRGRKPLPSPETEPVFYSMPYCPRVGLSETQVISVSSSSYVAPVSPERHVNDGPKWNDGMVSTLPLPTMKDPPSPPHRTQMLVIHCRLSDRHHDQQDDEMNLHTGDIAYFEGNRFHYIDRSDDERESVTASSDPLEALSWEEV